MFVVGVGELSGPIEAEAAFLAAELGATAYEARMTLSAGFPAVILTTPDRDRALALLGSLRGRGHLAVACDAEAVVSSADMVSMRHFAFGDLSVASSPAEGAPSLPFDDVFCLLPATHRRATASQTKEKERKFNAGLAIATSGLVMTKTVTKEKRSHVEEREQVLYVFRKSGAVPWLLRENDTVYTGLAGLAPMAPSRLENFREVVRILRGRAAEAPYDERLLALRRVPERARMAGTSAASTVTTSSDAGMDLLAHLLALTLSKQTRGATYRT